MEETISLEDIINKLRYLKEEFLSVVDIPYKVRIILPEVLGTVSEKKEITPPKTAVMDITALISFTQNYKDNLGSIVHQIKNIKEILEEYRQEIFEYLEERIDKSPAIRTYIKKDKLRRSKNEFLYTANYLIVLGYYVAIQGMETEDITPLHTEFVDRAEKLIRYNKKREEKTEERDDLLDRIRPEVEKYKQIK